MLYEWLNEIDWRILIAGACLGGAFVLLIFVIFRWCSTPDNDYLVLPINSPQPLVTQERLRFVPDKDSITYQHKLIMSPDRMLIEYWIRQDTRHKLKRERLLATSYELYVKSIPDWKFMSDAHVMIGDQFERESKSVTKPPNQMAVQMRRIRERIQEAGRPSVVGDRGISASRTRIPIVDTHHPGIQGMRPPWSRYKAQQSESNESQKSDDTSPYIYKQ